MPRTILGHNFLIIDVRNLDGISFCWFYLFIQLFMYVQNVSTKVQYLVYNCHHKHSVMRVHESEKELITVVYIITIIKANYNFK